MSELDVPDAAATPVPEPAAGPVPDPGPEEHVERYTDADDRAGRAAYRQIVGMLAAVPVLVIAFVVVYFAVPISAEFAFFGTTWKAQHVLLGGTVGLAVLLIGMALIQWARLVMSDVEVSEERHPAQTGPEARAVLAADTRAGVEESGIKRRTLIGSGVAGGLGLLVVPALLALGDLGPWPTDAVRKKTIEKTIWTEGIRLVNDVNYLPLKAADLVVGQLVNAEPETLQKLHGSEYQIAKAKAAIIVVRMDPNSIRIPDSRKDWQVDGILCYSKICTHVGCPISLWEQQSHHLLCPCHQSTFDLGNSGVVVFGPAARSLPQLPITTDADGYLVARSDFTVPVGPSFFERDSSRDFKDGDN
jgi:ubiquinol-cytochrome c reductase iron-sulfur subunit